MTKPKTVVDKANKCSYRIMTDISVLWEFPALYAVQRKRFIGWKTLVVVRGIKEAEKYLKKANKEQL